MLENIASTFSRTSVININLQRTRTRPLGTWLVQLAWQQRIHLSWWCEPEWQLPWRHETLKHETWVYYMISEKWLNWSSSHTPRSTTKLTAWYIGPRWRNYLPVLNGKAQYYQVTCTIYRWRNYLPVLYGEAYELCRWKRKLCNQQWTKV